MYIGVFGDAMRAILRFGPSMICLSAIDPLSIMLLWLWDETPACSAGSYSMPIGDDVPNVTLDGRAPAVVGVWLAGAVTVW